jgi:23S rRNA (uracil1939-C5)-methyltransferase
MQSQLPAGVKLMARRHRRPASTPQTVDFEIEHLDPLGQGVSRLDGKITFIAGVLPGETGKAIVYKRARGVRFARLKTLHRRAENRVVPPCPHVERCPGCQYLHTGYDSELEYKREALIRHLQGLAIDTEQIEVVAAPRRLAYRNRLQLHYRHRYIGLLDTVNNEVLEIPGCRILRKELQPVFDELQSGHWTEQHSGHGHCEIYYKDGEVSIVWDRPYAYGGFSQVYEEMNQVLKQRVHQQLKAL